MSNNHSFKLVCCDTDSITICKQDGSPFSKEEEVSLTTELNSLFPESIKWEFEFNIPKMIIFKAKNYVMKFPDGKIKVKGSAIKAPNKEPALREFIQKTVWLILEDKPYEDHRRLYETYVQEALDVKDIGRWSSKKTITDKVTNAQRSNEQKVKDIIQDTEYVEGDKIYVYFKSDGSLGLREHFDGDYCRKRLLKKIYDTAQVFDSVLPEDLYLNYSLKRNQKALEELSVKKAS